MNQFFSSSPRDLRLLLLAISVCFVSGGFHSSSGGFDSSPFVCKSKLWTVIASSGGLASKLSSVIASSPFVCKSSKVQNWVHKRKNQSFGISSMEPDVMEIPPPPLIGSGWRTRKPRKDSLPFTCVELGSSQVPLFSSQQDSTFGEDTPAERRARRKWTPTDDILLISSWLNTSKDPVVANEQNHTTVMF